MKGPQAMSREARRAILSELVGQIQAHYGSALRAVGVYGSVARDSDGPFSDIELYAVLAGRKIEDSLEWSNGAWKAEIDLYSADVLTRLAKTVEGDWPITHGALLQVRAIYDPGGVFERVRKMAGSQPTAAFRQAQVELIVGEIYETVGKIRNALAQAQPAPLALYASHLATYGACLVGLENRQTYTTSGQMFADSLALPGAPAGYETLCRAVMAGRLYQAGEIGRWSDALWEGIEAWANARGLAIHTSLEALLQTEDQRR
jgi:kanamycin nucleotidyltransferase